MAKQEYLVIGMGQYGMTVAQTLAKQGCGVIAVDRNKDKIQAIAPEVDLAVVADVTDAAVMKTLGLENVDTAIIALTKSMESSIMATILVKELGVRYVIVKAISEMHEKIALKLGADMVVFPEREMGQLTANTLVSHSFVDLVNLSPDISIVEMQVKPLWVGKTLLELPLRKDYHVNVIAEKKNDKLRVDLDPAEPLQEGQVLVMIGPNKSFKRLDH